jgi:hypothetical protein
VTHDDEAGPGLATVRDRYLLLEVVGTGGMGVVHRARDLVLNRVVALKTIRSELAGAEFVRRFEREAAILARVRSPHIVVVHDYGEHDGQFFMVTDFLPEGDLDQWLEEHGAMPVVEAVPLVAALAEGLSDAHEVGVLHRDIKPANVLLWRRSGRLHPVLADFGIAVTSDLALTKTGAVVGSPLYMAPERHLGEPASRASDVYAMGCLLYALLAGRPPFWGTTEFQAASAHLNDPVPTLPDGTPFGAEVDDIIAGCMAKDPADRIGSADDLAARLRAIAARLGRPAQPPADLQAAGARPQQPRVPTGETTVLSPTDPPPFGPRPSGAGPSDAAASGRGGRRRRLVGLAAALVLVVVVTGAWWIVAGDRGADPVDAAGRPGSAAAPRYATQPDPGEESSGAASGPDVPGPPRVRAESAYREVVFRGAVPATSGPTTFALERRDAGWTPARRVVTVPTAEGGERACATFRVVATLGSGRSEGPARRFCGRAEPRRVEIRANPAQCVFSTGRPCRYWDVVLSGFRPGVVSVAIRGEVLSGEVQDGQKVVTVGPDGYGTLGAHPEEGTYYGGGFKLDPDTELITVRADGVSDSLSVS